MPEGTRSERAQPSIGAEYRRYRRRDVIEEMADWQPGFSMEGVWLTEPDRASGSPKDGDKIARNAGNHADRWLVSAGYFAANFEPEPLQ